MSSSLSDLFAQRAYMRYWCSRIAGVTATQMLMVAVGWQMYALTNSAWDLGLVGLLQFLPALLMVLPAGYIVDHLHRGRIVAACMATQSVIALLLVLATHGHWITRELILFLSVMLGAARAFQMPAQQALVTELVPVSLLPRAAAFSSGGMQVAMMGGPALGGFLYIGGAALVYVVCFCLSLVGCILAINIRYEHVRRVLQPVSLNTLFAGLTFIWNNKILLGAVTLDLFAVLFGGAIALLPIFAKDVLHVGPSGMGLLRAAPAVGALCMSIILSHWTLENRVGRKLFWAVGMYGVATLVFGLSSYFLLSLIALAVSGFADSLSVVVRQSLTQLESPNEVRGRVAAVNSIFIGASNQLGEFESGATAALLGPVGSVVLGGVLTLAIVVIWMRLFPQLLHRDRLVPESESR